MEGSPDSPLIDSAELGGFVSVLYHFPEKFLLQANTCRHLIDFCMFGNRSKKPAFFSQNFADLSSPPASPRQLAIHQRPGDLLHQCLPTASERHAHPERVLHLFAHASQTYAQRHFLRLADGQPAGAGFRSRLPGRRKNTNVGDRRKDPDLPEEGRKDRD